MNTLNTSNSLNTANTSSASDNPYASPASAVTVTPQAVQYAGFWRRMLAWLIDILAIGLLSAPFLVLGPLVYFAGAAITIAFWVKLYATPGKMVVSARVVDATTGQKITPGQGVIRYLCYFLSAFFFCLGYIWIAFDGRKQGWHDKIAGTVVVIGEASITDV